LSDIEHANPSQQRELLIDHPFSPGIVAGHTGTTGPDGSMMNDTTITTFEDTTVAVAVAAAARLNKVSCQKMVRVPLRDRVTVVQQWG
jgi:hypothetical protein